MAATASAAEPPLASTSLPTVAVEGWPAATEAGRVLTRAGYCLCSVRRPHAQLQPRAGRQGLPQIPPRHHHDLGKAQPPRHSRQLDGGGRRRRVGANGAVAGPFPDRGDAAGGSVEGPGGPPWVAVGRAAGGLSKGSSLRG